jgi:CheY-like chemotaxis protein
MSVLIVEDNPVSSKLLEHTLNKYGYETHTANDAEQALEFLDKYPEIQLIITDILMPKTDGIELVRRIKDRPEWSDLPIIICTSKAPHSIGNRCFLEGCKLELKPIRADSLLRKVKDSLAQQRPVLQSLEQTRSQLDMDSQAFFDVLDEFLKLIKEKIMQLERHIGESSDLSSDIDLHNLLEGAKLLRADRLTDIVEKITRAASGKGAEEAHYLYPVLLRELKALQHLLADSRRSLWVGVAHAYSR